MASPVQGRVVAVPELVLGIVLLAVGVWFFASRPAVEQTLLAVLFVVLGLGSLTLATLGLRRGLRRD